jgi:hypothetical protein
MAGREHEHEREDAAEAPAQSPAQPAPAPPGSIAQMLMLQRTAGNAAVARAAAANGPVIARRGGRGQAAPPTGTVQSENGAVEEIEGATISGGAGYDSETEREMNIQRGLGDTMDSARIRMLETRTAVSSACESFRDHAISRIDAMDGAPSGYWAIAGGLAAATAGVVGALFPPAAIALAIGAAIQGAVQGAITEEVSNQRGDEKEQAKQAMRRFATATRDGFDIGAAEARSEDGPIYQRLWTLSLSDEEARLQFEAGSVEARAALLDQVGVTDPATNNAFELTLRALIERFGEWMGTQAYNNAWGNTGFDEMLSEHRGTDQYAERMDMVGAEQSVGTSFADEAVRSRQRR